jgi:N-acetylated-alpha-linked acidic dipeptidase
VLFDSYHSIYDSEYWMERYGDPGFHRHVKLAKVRAVSQRGFLTVQAMG